MGFETPAYLWGTLAALIPLALHLFNRRHARIVDFAAVEFILASNRRIARRLKLKQWLLLFLRTLLIAALPVAFAKPYMTTSEQALPATGSPASVVLVIDPSFSMGYRVHGTTLLTRAKEKALAIISDLRNESDAAVVVASSPCRALTQRLTYDRTDLRLAVESIDQSHGRADIQGALRLAEQILVASGQPQREVVLITDLQASEWEGVSRPWSLERSPGVTLVDTSSNADSPNVAVTGVVAEPESGSMGRDIRLTVTVLNDRPGAFEDVVTVRVGDRTAKGIIKVPPRQEGTKEFTVRIPDAGPVSGAVEIPSDDLPGDNSTPFVVDFLQRVHVLVVNGAPRTVPHWDETFFLRAALLPGRDSGSRMNPTFLRPDELTPAQLAYVDVVILANVAGLDAEQTSALLGFVRKGGGLLLTSGENVTPDTYNGPLRELCPLPVREVKDAEQPELLGSVRTSHPALAVFAHMPDASLFAAKTTRLALLDTAAAPETEVLASFSSGAPALVERRLGAGRLAMLTTTIDRDWTDLPFKTSYLPLVQQLILHLSGRLEVREEGALVVGEPYTIDIGRGVEEIRVLRPDGTDAVFTGTDLLAGSVRFRETDIAGIYSVRQLGSEGPDSQRKRDEKLFAVRIDPRESRLTSADRASLQVVLEAGQGATSTGLRRATPAPARRGELWPALLASLFVLLGFETWLAYRYGA